MMSDEGVDILRKEPIHLYCLLPRLLDIELELTSNVTVRWDAENGTVKCSGKYGKRGTGVLNVKQAASVESD